MPATMRPLLPGLFRRYLKKVSLRGTRYDYLNQAASLDSVYEREDFLGSQAAIPTRFLAGGAGTAAAVNPNSIGGALQLVTGAVNNQASILYWGQANFNGDMDAILAVRIQLLNAITAVKVEVGFSDNINVNTLAASGVGLFVEPTANPPTMVTLSASQTDTAVAAISDTGTALAGGANWRLATSKGAGPTTSITPIDGSGPVTAPVLATYQWVVVQLQRIAVASEDVSARLWVDRNLIATKALGAATFNKQLFPYVAIQALSGASRTLLIDVWNVAADRDTAQ